MLRRTTVHIGIPRPRRLRSAQAILLAFATTIAVGTLLLLLPAAAHEPTAVIDAIFTATSAVAVTGLTTVDTGTHWTGFGKCVLLALTQTGGLGVMSAASLLGLLVARRLGLRSQLTAEQERGNVGTSDIRRVLLSVVTISLAVEAAVALVLTARFWSHDHIDLMHAAWQGIFNAIMAYNNAGFALSHDSLEAFTDDPLVLAPIAVAIIVGGLGFPVLHELWQRHRRPRHWSLTTKIVLSTTAALLLIGWIAFAAIEWANSATLGNQNTAHKLMTALFASINTRTAGMTTFDSGAMASESWLITDMLMFIGAAPAGTSGGIKVTTLAVLFFIVRSELRGDRHVSAWGRRIAADAQRQAVAVAATATVTVIAAALILTMLTRFPIEQTIFETTSAFSTTGLSTGITDKLPDSGKLLLAALMLAGRLGVMTFGTALALRTRTRSYEDPIERPIIS